MSETKITRKHLRLHKGRSGGDAETFAKLPDEVLRSDAHRTLPHPARSVLVALAAQYRGYNNGSLTLTRDTALEYGITNPYAIDESLRELEARDLILETRPGTRPLGTLRARSAMFALIWAKIDPRQPDDPHDATPTIHARDTWRSWKASKSGMHWTVTRRDRSKEKDRNESSRPFRKKGDRSNSPVEPGDTKGVIPGIQRNGQPVIPGIPQTASSPLSRGCASEISGVGRARGERVQGGNGGSSLSAPLRRPASSSSPADRQKPRPAAPVSARAPSPQSAAPAAHLANTKAAPRKRRSEATFDDIHLALEMLKADGQSNGLEQIWAGFVLEMRQDGHTLEDIRSLWQWATGNEALRVKANSPSLLRYYWNDLVEARHRANAAPATRP